MTRQQVAKRLGRSVATVRRLEGGRLRPTQDSRGVHQFDPDEVDALARDVESGRVALWHDLGTEFGDLATTVRTGTCPRCVQLEQDMLRSCELLDQERAAHQRELRALQAAHDKERANHDAEARELAARLADFLDTLDS
jgi:Helix-turn-helix domain